MVLNSILGFALRSSTLLALNIMLVLFAQNTILKHRQASVKTLWIAAIIHAMLPFGILNINVFRDAISGISLYLRENTGIQLIIVTVSIIAACIFLSYDLRLYNALGEVVYVSRYDAKQDVYTCGNTDIAFTYGILNPKIVVPGNTSGYNANILMHERYHAECYDNAIKGLYTLLMRLYWFQPIIRISKGCFDNCIEMSCDEYVIQNTDVVDYCNSIVSQLEVIDEARLPESEIRGLRHTTWKNMDSEAKRRVRHMTRLSCESDKKRQMFRFRLKEAGTGFATVIMMMVMWSVGINQGEVRNYVEYPAYMVQDTDTVVQCTKEKYMADIIQAVYIHKKYDDEKIYLSDGTVAAEVHDVYKEEIYD